MPPGLVHTLSNPSETPVRFLNFNTPAGWENYMRDLAAALAKETPSQEEIGRIASRYDFRVAWGRLDSSRSRKAEAPTQTSVRSVGPRIATPELPDVGLPFRLELAAA